mgnify:CR=1 FL=1
MNWEKYLNKQSGLSTDRFFEGHAVVLIEDAKVAVRLSAKDILEQIEDCKFSQLGNLIEKLKEEYK